MRNPSLHIKKSDLVTVLKGLGMSDLDAYNFSENIMRAALKFPVSDRIDKLIDQTLTIRKKVETSIKADLSMPENGVEIFNQLLISERMKQQKWIKPKPIRKADREYLLLKDVAAIAWRFSEHFDIRPLKEGVTEFIKAGLKYMGKYSLSRFKYYEKNIYEDFEATIVCAHDGNSALTKQLYAAWRSNMEALGADIDITEIQFIPQKYQHFVYASAQINDTGIEINPAGWVDAQFEGLIFLNVVPELSQLYGENAKKRYDRHLLKAEDVGELKITDMYASN